MHVCNNLSFLSALFTLIRVKMYFVILYLACFRIILISCQYFNTKHSTAIHLNMWGTHGTCHHMLLNTSADESSPILALMYMVHPLFTIFKEKMEKEKNKRSGWRKNLCLRCLILEMNIKCPKLESTSALTDWC